MSKEGVQERNICFIKLIQYEWRQGRSTKSNIKMSEEIFGHKEQIADCIMNGCV